MRTIAVTLYGEEGTVGEISAASFESNTDAGNFCKVINGLSLKDGEWVYARTVTESRKYDLKDYIQISFDGLIERLSCPALAELVKKINSKYPLSCSV